jgi:D-alanyl-D-alanine carboxypeptidase
MSSVVFDRSMWGQLSSMRSVLNAAPTSIPCRSFHRRAVLQGLLAPPLAALLAGCGGGAAARWQQEAKLLQGLLDAETRNAGVYSAIGRLEIGDEVIFAGAAGTYSDLDKAAVRADTPFRAASVGKMFTAVAVLRLVERGKLSLDTAIGGLLPSALVGRLHVLDGVSRGAGLTVRQLLGHTTGLADIDSDPVFNGAVAQDPARRWEPEELLEFAIAVGPQFVPGTGQLYSSPNYTLLGLLIEAVTGKPYHIVVREEVLNRLGMSETFEETSEGPGPRKLAQSYIGNLNVNLASPSFEFADGGFVSTTADLSRFGHALARGTLFDRAETQVAMLQSQGSAGIGLGPWLDQVQLKAGAAAVAFHPGYWGVMLFVIPARDITIAFTVNQSDRDTVSLMSGFLGVIP